MGVASGRLEVLDLLLLVVPLSGEPHGDLLVRRLVRVGAVDDVAANVDAKVAYKEGRRQRSS